MSDREQKSLEAEVGDDGSVRLVSKSVPEVPIDQVDPRLRLGTLIRRARSGVGKGLKEVSDVLGISAVTLGQVERGMMPMSTDQLQQVASLTGVDYECLVQAAREFNSSIWSGTAADFRMVESDGEAKMLFPIDSSQVPTMPPEQLFVEYREGWFAGASGRDDPQDMSREWERGHEDGRLAMEIAFHQRRMDLGVPEYGDGKAGGHE